jgi:hypothetical protein
MNDAHWALDGADVVVEYSRGVPPLRRFSNRQRLAAAASLFCAIAGTPDALARPFVGDGERSGPYDVLHGPDLGAVYSSNPVDANAANAADGEDETAWRGRPGQASWELTFGFARPAHLGLIRTHWGESPVLGVPTDFRWEVLQPTVRQATCATNDGTWTLLRGTQSTAALSDSLARPAHRSWFVDADACGLRLVIDRTNAGPPAVREVEAVESAQDILEGALASDDGAFPGFVAASAIDGAYATRWAGAPGKSQWTLRVDLREPETIDRVRLVLGFDSVSVARRPSGRTYAVAWAPLHYVLETSEDGRRFEPIAYELARADGSLVRLRRRLVTLPVPRKVRSLRLVMMGATGANGVADCDGVPVIRELQAFRSSDRRPILAAPWILSVNANPSGQSHGMPGGELGNDAYFARFLQNRFRTLLPTLQTDDRFSRPPESLGNRLQISQSANAGEALESIEGDDPQLDAQWLAESSPPPIVILSGSNDWDYASDTGPDPFAYRHWHWDPLRDARYGGMGQLSDAVRERVAPFLGFCGGAQILALLEARGSPALAFDDQATIDAVLQRTSGARIRGFAQSFDLDRAWPLDARSTGAKIQFSADDKLFADVAGPLRRSATHALPEWHTDAVRPDAFLQGGPLARFDLVATSVHCTPAVMHENARDGVVRDPGGATVCAAVPEAFRSRDPAWPVIGAQFHAEQRDFTNAADGDPPESVADARLFLAGAYEDMVDAYERLSP